MPGIANLVDRALEVYRNAGPDPTAPTAGATGWSSGWSRGYRVAARAGDRAHRPWATFCR